MAHLIDNCFQEKSIKIIQTIFENNDQDSLTEKEITYEFKRLWNLLVGPTTNMENSKKKRCTMFNKNGKRCSFKIKKEYKTNVCTFHFNRLEKEKNASKDMSIDITYEEPLIGCSSKEETLSEEFEKLSM